MKSRPVFTHSGRALEELNMEAILSGRLSTNDFRIGSETLHHQAGEAEEAGYGQLAVNIRRAAELTRFTDQEIVDIYNMLRPRRASYRQLIALAERLELERGARMIAALIREAAEMYRAKGLRSG